jgi:predicted kinase
MSLGTPQARELAVRDSDGVHVELVWHPCDNEVIVSVADSRAGDSFQIAVAPDRALDAFYHPFAYAA